VGIDIVFFDLGGVVLRTEHQAPREHLAERLNVSYEDLVQVVFEGESARRASLGEITAQQHWEAVAGRLGRPVSEAPALRQEFFGGDVLDRELIEFVRTLRPGRRTGLISNAWADTRDYIIRNRFDDAFDLLVISAEVGFLKPDPRIYELALQRGGSAPAAALLVDDMPANVEGAVAAGMSAILFRDIDQLRHELARRLT
jgi:HAD superfamily hydrolase (TIGR01509 family)